MNQNFKAWDFIFLIFIAIASCNSKSSFTHVVLPELRDFTLDSIEVNPVLLNPISMSANDSLLIVFNWDTDTIFRVFSIPEFTYKGWFGLKGRGPEEFLICNPSSFRVYSDGIQLVDLTKVFIVDFVNDSVNNNLIVKNRYSIPSSLIPFNNVFMLDDINIYGINSMEDSPSEYDFFNKETKATGSLINFPELDSNVSPKIRRRIFVNLLEVKPDKSRFVMMYNYYPVLRIFNNDIEVLHEIFIDNLPKQIRFKSLGTKHSNFFKGIIYYSYLKVTEKYIYTLFELQTGEKVREREYRAKSIGSQELHVFNWEGQPVARIKLNNKILSFAPSPDNKYLFFTCDHAIDKIYWYKFNDILP